MALEVCVLGPLEVRSGGALLPIGAPKQQVVLAMLAVDLGRVVTIPELADELWPEGPPPSAVPNVRAYVANVRRLFDSVPGAPLAVGRQGVGYAMTGDGGAVDLQRFRADVANGEEAATRGDTAAAVERFTSALGRWRGGMLAGLALGPALRGRCATIEEERLALVDRLGDLYVGTAEPERAIALLRGHVHGHPTRERAQAALMRALYQVGDIAAALATYATAREALVEQLGIEPGAELQEVHKAVLNRDVTLDLPRQRRAATGRGLVVPLPRELPPEPGHFLGRERETARALEVLAPREPTERRRPTVVVFHGPAGSGKSALAVHVAHRAGAWFPDGHLYIDLLGATPGLRPLDTTEVVRRMLLALGVSGADVPEEPPLVVGQFRSLTADARLLLLLDNVRDADQVADVIPASGRSAVIITGRDALPTLDVDHRERLDGLPEREGMALLRLFAPDADLDDETARRIVGLCDQLPLALRVVAGRLAGGRDSSGCVLEDLFRDRRMWLNDLRAQGGDVYRWLGRHAGALWDLTRDSSTRRTSPQRTPELTSHRVPDPADQGLWAGSGEGTVEPGVGHSGLSPVSGWAARLGA